MVDVIITGVTDTSGVLADPPILVLELAAVGTSLPEVAPPAATDGFVLEATELSVL